jgi:hypothetical protein
VVVNLVDLVMTRVTGLNRDVPKVLAVLVVPMLVLISRKVTDGASAYLDATVAEGKESHGCFIMDWEIRP